MAAPGLNFSGPCTRSPCVPPLHPSCPFAAAQGSGSLAALPQPAVAQFSAAWEVREVAATPATSGRRQTGEEKAVSARRGSGVPAAA
jgi:hypothetical protein